MLGKKSVILVTLLSFVCVLFGQSSNQIADWQWQKSITIPTSQGLLYFNWTNSGVEDKLNVTIWPCFGPVNLFESLNAYPSPSSFASSNQYTANSYVSELWAGVTNLGDSNVSIAIQAFTSFTTNTQYAAKFDIVVRSDVSIDQANGYTTRVPSPGSISYTKDTGNNQAAITFTLTGNPNDVYSYWRYNTTYNSTQTGYVSSTACGVRQFMEPAYPIEVEVSSAQIRATFEVEFGAAGFEYNSFIVMVTRNCTAQAYQCYEAVYQRMDINTASLLSLSLSSSLMFILLALFLSVL